MMGNNWNEGLRHSQDRVDSVDPNIVRLHHAILSRAILDLLKKETHYKDRYKMKEARTDAIAWFIAAPSHCYSKRITVQSCFEIVELGEMELPRFVKRLFTRGGVTLLEAHRTAKYVEKIWEEELNIPLLRDVYGKEYF